MGSGSYSLLLGTPGEAHSYWSFNFQSNTLVRTSLLCTLNDNCLIRQLQGVLGIADEYRTAQKSQPPIPFVAA